jgi:hypothetical protein
MDYVHNTLLPSLLKEETNQTRQEMGEESYQEKLRSFLKPYRLSTIGVTTISRWMNLLGFKYGLRKKGTMLMDMRNLQRYSIAGPSANGTFIKKSRCIAGFR